jgi:hypothetical protein
MSSTGSLVTSPNSVEERPVPAKIVVKPYRGGSRVSLVGSSGKELLASSVFKEPRAKGATLRALKGLLGDDVVVEDHTVASAKAAAAKTVAAAKIVAAAKTVAAANSAEVVVASTKPVAKRVGAKPGPKPTARAARSSTNGASK